MSAKIKPLEWAKPGGSYSIPVPDGSLMAYGIDVTYRIERGVSRDPEERMFTVDNGHSWQCAPTFEAAQAMCEQHHELRVTAFLSPAPQRAPEEVAARLRVLRWAAREASNKFDCFDDFEEAVRVAYQPHNIPSYADEISAALRDLCRWAADGADPETAAALEAAAGEMSKD